LFYGQLFGVDNVAIAFDIERSDTWYQSELFAIGNTIACCALCAAGKGLLTGDEYLGLVMHIRSFNETRRARCARRWRESTEGRGS
jgi:hypothetical protein